MLQQINEDQVKALTADLAAKAPLASPAFTGTPTAPTPATGDNSTTLATTAFVKAQASAGGITALTGDVTASGTGSVAATVTATHLAAPLPVAQGGTGTTAPGIVAGSNIAVTGTWPNQTVAVSNAPLAPNYVQGVFAIGTTGLPAHATLAFTASNVAGHAIVVDIRCSLDASGQALPTVADSNGNTYAAIAHTTPINNGGGIWYSAVSYVALNVAGGANAVTVTSSGQTYAMESAALEYSNVASASALDGTPSAQNSALNPTSPFSAGSITTSNANSLVHLASWVMGASSQSNSSSWSASLTGSTGLYAGYGATEASAGTYSNSVSWSPSSPEVMTVMFALKGTGSSLTPVTSVFGRTGAVVAATNDYSFAQISGVATTAQLPSTVPTSLTTTGTSGAATLSGGVLNIPQYSGGTGGGMTNPMTTSGDLITGGASGAAGRLGVGSTGQVLTVVSGAPAWAAAGSGSGALVLLEQHAASASASLLFTGWYSTNYDQYVIEVVNLIPTTTSVSFTLLMSTNGGTSYDTSASIYTYAAFRWIASGNGTAGNNGGTSSMVIDGGSGVDLVTNVAANGGLCGSFKLFNPGSTTAYKLLTGQTTFFNQNGNWDGASVVGSYKSTTAVNAFKISTSSGTIASGTVRIYGLTH